MAGRDGHDSELAKIAAWCHATVVPTEMVFLLLMKNQFL